MRKHALSRSMRQRVFGTISTERRSHPPPHALLERCTGCTPDVDLAVEERDGDEVVREGLGVRRDFLGAEDSREGPECVRRRVAHASTDRLDTLLAVEE